MPEPATSRPALFHVVMLEPEIPNNTGNIGRTCLVFGCALHLIRPLGFDTSVKALRRAGMDYWPRVNATEHDSWEAYRAATGARDTQLWLTSGKRGRPIWDAELRPGDHLVFGKETAGLPPALLEAHADRVVTIPMMPGERGLNVATAVCAVVMEGVRQCVARGEIGVDGVGRLERLATRTRRATAGLDPTRYASPMHAHSHDHASGHSHGHSHAHPDPREVGTKRLAFAVGLNLLLTVAQVVGGLAAGSLALVADALHNFSDAGALILTLVARKIAGRPADESFTFGYRRAQVVAALINLTVIILISVYLAMEAVVRFFEHPKIDGWIVVIVAGVALVIDVATAMLTFAMSKGDLNVRAAFIHNVGDALASVGVIIAGTLIILFDWYWADLGATLVISAYLIYVSWDPLKQSIAILMQAVPRGMDLRTIGEAIASVEGVRGVHHVHVWPMDEDDVSIEAHILIGDESIGDFARIKSDIRRALSERFSIRHSTLEVELAGEACADEGLVVEHDAKSARGEASNPAG